jgi:salicylate hydroxylase
LTLAVALSQHQDIAVDVYEAAQTFCEIGAGVGAWPRAFRVRISENKCHSSLRQSCRSYGNWDPTSNSNYFNAVVTNTQKNMVSGNRIRYMFKSTERNLVAAVKSRKSDQAVGVELFDLMTKGQPFLSFKCIPP